jgi:hypothetical protein
VWHSPNRVRIRVQSSFIGTLALAHAHAQLHVHVANESNSGNWHTVKRFFPGSRSDKNTNFSIDATENRNLLNQKFTLCLRKGKVENMHAGSP